MAKIPTFICFGNSNTDGFASLDDLTGSAFQRWTGVAPPSTYPIDVEVPGVRFWSPKYPSTPATDYTVTAKGASTVDLSGFMYSSGTHDNRWVYVREATAGQGQYRKITSGAGAQITVSPAWTTQPSVGAIIEFLSNSHTCNTGSTTSSVVSFNSVSNPVGKWIVFISGALAGMAQRIASGSSNTLVLENPLIDAPESGDGFVICSNTATVDGASTNLTANGSLRNLRFYQDYAYHFSTGYEYPNWKSYPFSTSLTVGPNVYRDRDEINWVPELAWQLRQRFTEAPVFIHCGVPSSSMGTKYIGSLSSSVGSFSWLYDITHLDWQPSSPNGVYDTLTAFVGNTAAALISEGNEIDIQGVFAVVSDIDAESEVYANKAADNLRNLVKALREFIDAGNYSSKRASSIPFVFGSVATTTYAYQNTVNAALTQLAEDDPYVKVVDASAYTLETDQVHWDAPACQEFGVDAFSAWSSALVDESDATRPQDDLPTLADIRTKVRRRYERTVTANDITDEQMDLFINDAIREIYNTLGDNAWFLRRSETLTMSTTYPGTLTLPRKVKRLIRVDRSAFPGSPVKIKGLTYTDQGRLQVTLMDYSGGPFVAHYILLPKDLEQDSDTTLIPWDHIELIVMLTCKRLAESGGNAAIASYYAGETQRLWQYAKRDALRYDRIRGGVLESNDHYAPPSWRMF